MGKKLQFVGYGRTRKVGDAQYLTAYFIGDYVDVGRLGACVVFLPEEPVKNKGLSCMWRRRRNLQRTIWPRP